MPQTSLTGQTALITGAAKRIGREIAFALAGEGANVVAHYRTSAGQAEELCRELRERGVQAWPLAADLAQEEQAEALIARAIEVTGRLDMLVNNASIFPPSTLGNLTLESICSTMQVNAWTPFVLSRAFARQVARGKIVNLLDSRITGYNWSHVAYHLSKHLLAILTRMTALRYAPEISVNAVAPGLILPPPGRDESYLDKLIPTVPLKRRGTPRDIADAVLFLLKSDFLTGEVIYVDGGWHLTDPHHGAQPD